MTEVKDDYASHMYDIGQATTDVLIGKLPSGWPTVMAIYQNVFLDPSLDWPTKNKITRIVKPNLGDTVHWFKVKFDQKQNFTRAVKYILSDGEYFKPLDPSNTVLNSCGKVFQTKNSTYIIDSNGGMKICDKSGNIKTATDISGNFSDVKDSLSIDSVDYLLGNNGIYRIADGTSFKINVPNSNAFCAVSNVIIVATNSGGVKIKNPSSASPQKVDIKYKSKIETVSDPDAADGSTSSISITVTNGVPNGRCDYAYPSGNTFYIGDTTTCGHFDASSDNFDKDLDSPATPSLSFTRTPYLSGGNKNSPDGSYGPKDGGTIVNGVKYNVTNVTSVYVSDKFNIFCTSSGVKAYTKTKYYDSYGTDECMSTITKGIQGSGKYIAEIDGDIFIITDSGKYISVNESDNKNVIYVFNTDYDKDSKTGDTDIKQVVLNLLKTMSIVDGSGFTKYLENANNGKGTYAIILCESSPKSFILLGDDNRNAYSKEAMNAFGSFDADS